MTLQTISAQMSEKLQYGDVSGIEEALKCVIRGMDDEIEQARAHGWEAGHAHRYRNTAQQALNIWREEELAAQARFIERMRALSDTEPGAEEIADALDEDNLDTLAW